jgi:hypothetical protein
MRRITATIKITCINPPKEIFRITPISHNKNNNVITTQSIPIPHKNNIVMKVIRI